MLHFITNRFAEEERLLKEDHRRKMDEYIQRKRRSMTSSPVGNHKLPSTNDDISSSNIKVARLKQHNHFVPVPTTSTQAPYTTNQTHVQHQYHQQHHMGLPPEGENMERKVKEALMTELSSKPKPSGKSDSSTKPYHHKTDNTRLHSKTMAPSQQLQQGYHTSVSTSTWPREDFHSGSNPNMEMTPEPPNITSNSKPDISEFDPIETNK